MEKKDSGGRPIIQVRNLSKVYVMGEEHVIALKNVNLSINKGEICCIFGTSGSGKSTLLNQLAGLEKPTRGEVLINGRSIPRMNENELAAFRQEHIGFVFQSYNLLKELTCAENVAMPLMFHGVPKDVRELEAKKMLHRVGLLNRMNHFPGQMSGGQQQRVAIARAIAAQPPVILADEPTGNLDSASSKEILQILKSMHEQGKTVILITHDNGIAAQARRVVRIMDGKIESDFINKNYGKEEYIKNQLDA